MALGAGSQQAKTRVFFGEGGHLSRVAHVLAQERSPARLSLFLAPRMAKYSAKKPRGMHCHSEKETGESARGWAVGVGQAGAPDRRQATRR